jgi:hypothetical protein
MAGKDENLTTNKFKITAVAITTSLLATSMGTYMLRNKTASTASTEASTVTGITETPSESTGSPDAGTVPDITETSSEEPQPSDPVVEKLTILRTNVEKVTSSLAARLQRVTTHPLLLSVLRQPWRKPSPRS